MMCVVVILQILDQCNKKIGFKVNWKVFKNYKIGLFNQSMFFHHIFQCVIPLAILFAFSHSMTKCTKNFNQSMLLHHIGLFFFLLKQKKKPNLTSYWHLHKSSSLVEGWQEFHLHTIGFKPTTLTHHPFEVLRSRKGYIGRLPIGVVHTFISQTFTPLIWANDI